MDNAQIFSDKLSLAAAAASQAIALLQQATTSRGRASWVLSGGTTPNLAYRAIVEHHLHDVDWSKVTIVIGDERIGPLDSSDNNWHTVEQAFLQFVPNATLLRPMADQPAEQAAIEYEQAIAAIDHYDLVWLGIGEDGHTLSLFPNHPDFQPTQRLVIPVHNSPKPPADRISLTLHALERADRTFILASGDDKANAVKQALRPNSDLPVAQAAALTRASWLIDQSAGSLLVQRIDK